MAFSGLDKCPHHRGGRVREHLIVTTVSLRLALEGPGDLAAARDLRAAIAEAVSSGRLVVALDLARVTMAGSALLATIVGADKALRARGGRLVILRPTSAVCKTLQRCGLDRALEVVRAPG